MSKYKHFTILILLFALTMGLLSGCASHGAISTQPSVPGAPAQTDHIPSETASNPTEQVATPTVAQIESWVSTAFDETVSWTDAVGNNNTVHIRIPKILSEQQFAAAYNESVARYGEELLEEAKVSAAGAYSTHIVSVNYDACLNDGLLSILLTTETSIDYTEYCADNFDLENGEHLSTADMCNKYLNLDYPQFLKLTHDMILQDFDAQFADFAANAPEDHQFIRKMFESDAQIVRNRTLYLNENGTLMLICDRPSIAGASAYCHIEEMKIDPSLIPTQEDAYGWIFDLYLRADEDNQPFALEILRMACENNAEGFHQQLEKHPESVREAIRSALGQE